MLIRGQSYTARTNVANNEIPNGLQTEVRLLGRILPVMTSNYAIRDPSIIDIVKKYGLAGLASAPALTEWLP